MLLELAQSFNVSHEALQGTFKEVGRPVCNGRPVEPTALCKQVVDTPPPCLQLADPEAVAEEAEEAEPANSGAAGPSRGSRKDAAASTL